MGTQMERDKQSDWVREKREIIRVMERERGKRYRVMEWGRKMRDKGVNCAEKSPRVNSLFISDWLQISCTPASLWYFLTHSLIHLHPCLGRQKSTTWLSLLNFCLYKPCVMCLIWLHFQPCAGSEPDCNCCCCLSNKYTYMQLRSPEVTRVNFHLTRRILPNSTEGIMDYMTKDCTESLAISWGLVRLSCLTHSDADDVVRLKCFHTKPWAGY